MAVASASLAVSIEDAFGPTVSYWRLRNMSSTPSLLSRSEMIIFLKTVQYLLETCRPLLNDYEKLLLRDFVISLAGSMVKIPGGRITISLCSDTVDAITELHEETELYAVINAACCPKVGDKVSPNSEHWSNPAPLTSRDMSVKSGQEPTTRKGVILHLPGCHSDRELD